MTCTSDLIAPQVRSISNAPRPMRSCRWQSSASNTGTPGRRGLGATRRPAGRGRKDTHVPHGRADRIGQAGGTAGSLPGRLHMSRPQRARSGRLRPRNDSPPVVLRSEVSCRDAEPASHRSSARSVMPPTETQKRPRRCLGCSCRRRRGRTMLRPLRTNEFVDEAVAELEMIVGREDSLAAEAARPRTGRRDPPRSRRRCAPMWPCADKRSTTARWPRNDGGTSEMSRETGERRIGPRCRLDGGGGLPWSNTKPSRRARALQ